MTNLSQRPVGGSRRAFAFFRWAATLLAVMSLVQAGLAASYLGGDYAALDMHGINGRVVVGLAVVTVITTIWLRRTGGPMWPVPASLVLLLALAGEMGMGMARVVSMHIAFGVLVVSGISVLVVWAWLAVPPKATAPAPPAEGAEPERSSEHVS